MSAIDDLFARLKSEQRKALMPFLTAGDPSLEATETILDGLAAAGADLCEIGIPYSDPIADGPVIQASYQRALDRGFRLQDAFDLGTRKSAGVKMPLVTMVSYAIIFRIGLQAYVDRAKAAGYAGAIVPDLLVEEAAEFSKVCRDNDFSLIQLVTPTTPRERTGPDRRFVERVSLLRVRHRDHGRAECIADRFDRERQLASRANRLADLHRIRHQRPRNRGETCPRGRWIDRRFGDRSADRGEQ